MKRCITIAFLLFVASSAVAAGDLKVTVSGNGVVSNNPSSTIPFGTISCRQSVVTGCTTLPSVATTITLTATPDSGNVFMGWSGACSSNAPCQVRIDPRGLSLQVTATFKKNIYLLLHGMNSDATTWNDLVDKNKPFFGSSCPQVMYGVLPSGNINDTRCFRINFGLSKRLGLESQPTTWQRGDGATFSELGEEVNVSVLAILGKYPSSVITLVGHSRGGLAARAFLQGNSPLRSKVVGLLTIGTPHNGSPLGRIYSWLQKYPRDYCTPPKPQPVPTYCTSGKPTGKENIDKDWKAADQIHSVTGLTGKPLDVRSPTINFLAIGSNEINTLNRGVGNLAGSIRYAEIVSNTIVLGNLHGLLNVWDMISEPAKTHILNGQSRDSYLGDGIVSLAHQRMSVLRSGFSVIQPAPLKVRHIEETGQTAVIISTLDSMAR